MTARTAELDHQLITALRDAVPVPLVLHGSSGVADDELGRAVAHGIVKINVGTILNVAFTRAVRSQLAGDETVVDPRRYLYPPGPRSPPWSPASLPRWRHRPRSSRTDRLQPAMPATRNRSAAFVAGVAQW